MKSDGPVTSSSSGSGPLGLPFEEEDPKEARKVNTSKRNNFTQLADMYYIKTAPSRSGPQGLDFGDQDKSEKSNSTVQNISNLLTGFVLLVRVRLTFN